MKDGLPFRRSQLVTTFGPGSLVVSPEGETAIIGSLDKWYYDKNGNKLRDIDEFEIHEPRLQFLLKVKKLYLPPDFRPSFPYKSYGKKYIGQNTDIYIPLLRFPTWHYCPNCHTLNQLQLSSKTSVIECKECKQKRRMIQVPFVIVCKHGHISDFPWREWVHRDENTTCNGKLTLMSTGGATLDSLKVTCSCGKERSLKGITSRGNSDGIDNTGVSYLSRSLNDNPNTIYKCPGSKPWFGNENERDECNEYPIAVLKNSINVYFPNTISAIHLPGEYTAKVENIIDIFERFGVTSSWLETYTELQGKINFVKKVCKAEINEFSDEEIERAILYMEQPHHIGDKIDTSKLSLVEKELRQKEFRTLADGANLINLKVVNEWAYNEDVDSFESHFNLINRVTRLKETIVLTSFSRLNNVREQDKVSNIRDTRGLLFKNPNLPENDWLPAYKVYGEGIFFTLNYAKLEKWEANPYVSEYFSQYKKRVERYSRLSEDIELTPRFVLLHTLAHVVIDELALTCGYNTAEIRERLYLDTNQSSILLYTSSGDSDGTFGGLVRMGKSNIFFSVVHSALDKARWCSSDPVCSEIGMKVGQGVNNLNGAACHSCAYLPETSCELGNLYLDRTLLIDNKIGFFKLDE